MREKPLKDGRQAYFWEQPQLYRKHGFIGHADHLEPIRYGCGAGRLLTAHLDAWRTGRGATVPQEAFNFGTVGWVFDRYLKSSAFERRVSMHKTPEALRLYVKPSEQQRAAAGRKRRSYVAKSTQTRTKPVDFAE